jgi:hypothetical protein
MAMATVMTMVTVTSLLAVAASTTAAAATAMAGATENNQLNEAVKEMAEAVHHNIMPLSG